MSDNRRRRTRNPFAVKMGHRMRKAREERGLLQADVASALGVTLQSYGAYERGWVSMPIETLVRLPDILGRPVIYFLGLPSDSEITEEEQSLLHDYRSCPDPIAQRAIRSMVREHSKFCDRVARSVRAGMVEEPDGRTPVGATTDDRAVDPEEDTKETEQDLSRGDTGPNALS